MKRTLGHLEVSQSADTGALQIVDPEVDCGWEGLVFYIENDDGTMIPGAGKIREDGTGWIWSGASDGGRGVDLRVSATAGGGIVLAPVLRNEGPDVWIISGYGFSVQAGAKGAFLGGGRTEHPVFAHAENLRVERAPFYGPQFPFIRPLGAEALRLGDSPAGSIPALALGREGLDTWLVEAQWTRNSHRISWDLQWGMPEKRMANRTSRFTWNGVDHIAIPPGESLVLESTLFQVVREPADRIFTPYIEELKRTYSFAAETSTLAREPVFCTWNYNVFTNINESDCQERIRIAAEIQGESWFQIDHGYQPGLDGKPVAYFSPDETRHVKTKASVEVDAYYPDATNAWDLTRFPSGAQGLVAACKAQGLKPSIWWSPRVDRNGAIQREHPDWILADKNESRLDVGHLMLDYSLPEVRDFLELCVRKITQEWGFQGIKLDFFSWMFEHPDACFRRGGTGLEWKRQFVGMIRSHLGPQGYFLHCISCPQGDPFLGVWGFDAFRAGIDIDSGEWHYHVKSVGWLLPSILAHGRGTCFPNIDSCLGKPEIPAIERRSRLDFAYISGGMLELSGPCERFDAAMTQDWKRLIERCDQGGEVRCPDQQAFYGRPLPRILVRPHHPESHTFREWAIRSTIGLFNWTDTPQVVGFTAAEAGLKPGARLVDFWSGAEISPSMGDSFSIALPGRGSVLLDAICS